MEQPLKALQQAQKENRNQAQQAFTSLYNLLNQKTNSEQELRDSLLDLLPALVNQYGDQAATIAVDWYNEAREQAIGVDGFYASMEDVPNFPETAIQDTVRWQAGLLWGNNQDKDAFARFMVGAVDRWVHVRGTNTIATNAERDPQSGKWAVAPVGVTCAWCTMLASRDFVYKTQDTAKAPLHAHCDCEVIPDWGEKYNQAILRGYDPRVYNRIYNQASELWETADANRLHLKKGQRPLTEDEQRIVDYATKSTIRWYGNKAVHKSDEYKYWRQEGKTKEEKAAHDRALSVIRKDAEAEITKTLHSNTELSADLSRRMKSMIMRLQSPQNLTDGQRIEDAMVGDMKMSDWMTFRDKLAQRYLTTTKRSDKMPPLVPDNVGTLTLGGRLKLPTSVYNHIAYGAYEPKKKKFLGGHLNGFGWVQGKDEFPAEWTMSDIMKAAKHVLEHPAVVEPERVIGTYRGFSLYIWHKGDKITTISPLNGGEG